MTRQRSFWDSHHLDRIHQQRLIKKRQRIQGLLDLLNTWEAHHQPDHPYIRELRAKVRSAENQLEAMQI